jgi:hypothetical protein
VLLLLILSIKYERLYKNDNYTYNDGLRVSVMA